MGAVLFPGAGEMAEVRCSASPGSKSGSKRSGATQRKEKSPGFPGLFQ
jgi:hypothetical protein